MIEITAIDTPSLGNRSYLVSDGRVAMAIDPPRDSDRVLAEATRLGVAITHVFETHLHNDYITGGLALARHVDASYCVSAEDRVGFGRVAVMDSDLIDIGDMAIRVVATPGHTFTHLSYVLLDADSGSPAGVFTGGSLLCGSTGRPDLLGPANTRTLAGAQHRSARRLASLLPDATPIFPTHGFGSFCAATPATGTDSTIGGELRSNPALLLDREPFVKTVLAALDAYPAYYTQMAPANAAGPAAADLTAPPLADFDEVGKRIAAGEWVADLRARRDFAAGHLPGSFSFEFCDSFATNLGWLLPWGTPLTVLADEPPKAAAAQRQLARIGIAVERTGSVASPALAGEPLASYPVSDFAGLAAALRQDRLTVLDVRRNREWSAGHLAGAAHLPLHDLRSRAHLLPDLPIWVHCEAGYRAGIAASILQAAGHSVTAVDDDFAHATHAGLTVVKPDHDDLEPHRRA